MIRVQIAGLGDHGEGVGRLPDGMAVFVPGAIPGDRVEVEVTERRKNFARGRVVRLLEPGSGRVQPLCPVVGECGGCQLQHVDYATQLAFKAQAVRDALQRIAGLDPAVVADPLGCADPWGYRNKAQFPVGEATGDGRARLVAGMYRRGSHDIVEIDDCLIQHPTNNAILREAKRLAREYGWGPYDEREHTGVLRHILARTGVRTGQAMAVLVTATEALPRAEEFARELMAAVPQVVSVQQNVNSRRTNVILGERTRVIAGAEAIEDVIAGLRFRISARSFFQVNTEQTEVLYGEALRQAELHPEDTALDLYCGIGTISLLLARACRRVIGVEEVPEAIADARANAALNGIGNAEFHAGLVEALLPRLAAAGIRPDVVLLDPPRKGVDAAALDAVALLAPRRIVYVSCNPATLARDLKHLAGRGYRTELVRPVDMFPHTSHVECVASLVVSESGCSRTGGQAPRPPTR